MGSLQLPPGSKITIKPITSEVDLPICARLADIALKPDGLHEFKTRYGSKSVYQETLEKLTEALRDPQGRFRLFKAVVPAPKQESREPEAEDAGIIVGFAHWRYGYVDVPKVDPFAPRGAPEKDSNLETGGTNVAVAEAKGQVLPASTAAIGGHAGADGVARPEKQKPYYLAPDAELSRKLMNSYISTIRGKRHVYLHRLMVDPSYQRQGIGQKLLDWGIETGNRENIVAWLFCRPAGYKLYEKNGWKIVQTIEVDVPDDDLRVPPVVAMLRLPAGRRG